MKRETLDARRLLCPMPVIRTQQAVKKLQAGDELEIICTDPGTMHDITTWCRMYGHQVLAAEQRENNIFFFILKLFLKKRYPLLALSQKKNGKIFLTSLPCNFWVKIKKGKL